MCIICKKEIPVNIHCLVKLTKTNNLQLHKLIHLCTLCRKFY